jgi:uncharacterized protein YneF (UPF0154 family)
VVNRKVIVGGIVVVGLALLVGGIVVTRRQMQATLSADPE